MGHKYTLMSPEHVFKQSGGREWLVEDRAIFKSKKYDRLYRSAYHREIRGGTYSEALKLYVATSLKEAQNAQRRVLEATGELFHIYRDGLRMEG